MQEIKFQRNKKHQFMGNKPRWYLGDKIVDKFRSSFAISESNSNSVRLQRMLEDIGALPQEK